MTEQRGLPPEWPDYEDKGLTIQQAMLDTVRTGSFKGRSPPAIRWGEQRVQTSDCVDVPLKGRLRIEFLYHCDALSQGVDVKVNGVVHLADGSEVTVLRTWRDDRYEDNVEYTYTSSDGKIWIWNVYEVTFPSGQKDVAKWTDNAGFWIEHEGPRQRIYHCSAGPCNPPNFESLRFRLTVL